MVSEDATKLIEKLADTDIPLYRLAVDRFESDVRAAGMSCWLKKQVKPHESHRTRDDGHTARSREGQRRPTGAQEHTPRVARGQHTRNDGHEHTPPPSALTP